MSVNTNVLKNKVAGGWEPNLYLTNMSMAYFLDLSTYAATSIFPICPVPTSTGNYYSFSKGDLARDNMQRKPVFGKVDPAVMGHDDHAYFCKVDQIIAGLDSIGTLNYQRSGAPGAIDPRRARVRFITEQMHIHLDRLFAEHFFKPGIWANEWAGVTGSPAGNQFHKFTDGNFDPVNFFTQRMREIQREGRRKPNGIAFGVEAFDALCEHPDILERVKYTGSTANPATVNADVLAQLFGVRNIHIIESTHNTAKLGEAPDMQYICNPKSALLYYATDMPTVDEPSAGYTFTWDMLGNGQYMALDQYEGEKGTHSEYIEGLMATDMRKTADDLALFMKDCV